MSRSMGRPGVHRERSRAPGGYVWDAVASAGAWVVGLRQKSQKEKVKKGGNNKEVAVDSAALRPATPDCKPDGYLQDEKIDVPAERGTGSGVAGSRKEGRRSDHRAMHRISCDHCTKLKSGVFWCIDRIYTWWQIHVEVKPRL